MGPQAQFCHDLGCPARGVVGQGNIRAHSRKERRYRCTACGRTFAATRGTPSYRLEAPPGTVTTVTTLLGHGCPPQPVVAAFGLDKRAIAWAGADRSALPRPPGAPGPAGAGRSAARPGRRGERQGGRPAALGGDGDGRPRAALAGRGDQPAPGPGPDYGAGREGARLRPGPGDPGLRRRPGRLHPGPAHSGRAYHRAAEASWWQAERAREELAGDAVVRQVDARGLVSVYGRNYPAARKYAGESVSERLDAARGDWLIELPDGPRIGRHPAELSRDAILGRRVTRRHHGRTPVGDEGREGGHGTAIPRANR